MLSGGRGKWLTLFRLWLLDRLWPVAGAKVWVVVKVVVGLWLLVRVALCLGRVSSELGVSVLHGGVRGRKEGRKAGKLTGTSLASTSSSPWPSSDGSGVSSSDAGLGGLRII